MKAIVLVVMASMVVVLGAVVTVQYDEWFVYPGLRAHVNAHMKDPASTQFRNEKLAAGGWLCGEMNAKNSYGAYTGFKRFISGSSVNVGVEGAGYVGVKQERSTAEIIEFMDVKNEILRARIDLQNSLNFKTIFNPYSDDEIELLAEKKIFAKKWDRICT